jgi:peptide/nickel transport system substrate-binding protein
MTRRGSIFPTRGGSSILRPTRRDLVRLGLAAGAGMMAADLPGTRGARAAPPPGKPAGQVVIGFSQEPTVFNPHMLHIEVDEGVHWNIFSPLWGVAPDGSFTPHLATEVPTVENGGVSPDGLHWRVKLRDDVTWHDGKAFTAEDVKYTFELIVDPRFRTARKVGHDLVRDITVESPTQINWRMEKAYAPYHSILAWTFMVPKHVLGPAPDPNTAPFNNAPIGTGPFKWGRRVAGDHILLTANDRYFGKGPHLERIIFKYIPDLTVLFTQFKTGDIDYIGLQGITADHYSEAKALPDRVVVPVPAPFIETLSLNLGKPQLADKAVRQALYLGLDKKTIIDTIYYGLPNAAESYLPTQSAYFDKDLPRHEYDPAKAKAILDQAGWVAGPDGIRAKAGQRLEIVHSTTAGNHVRELAQQYLQQSWREIGVQINISNMPAAVMWGDYWTQSKFEAAFAGIGFMTGPDPDATDYFVFLPVVQYAQVEGTKKGLMGFEPNLNVRCNTWNVNEWYWAT